MSRIKEFSDHEEGEVLEFIRPLAARLRKFIANRRVTTRYKVSLPVRISILDARKHRTGNQSLSRLDCHTRDVSQSGLALIVPSIRIGGEYLTHQLRILVVEVELPTGIVEMQTSSARYRMLDKKDVEKGHLISVRITAMTEDHRKRYRDYLRTLS